MTHVESRTTSRKTNPLLLFAAGVLALGGCATGPTTRYSSGPIKARTYNFVRLVEDQEAPYADNRAEAHALIQAAIEESLASKGLTRVETNGDVAVLYLIIISDSASTATVNDYFGYSDSSYDLQELAHQTFVLDKRNRTPFPAGTLVIDIVNMEQRKVLWRNFVYRPIMRHLPIEQRQARVQEAVNDVFKGLQIAE